MKKMLFYTENFCEETSKGGLEVATFRIAKALRESGKWEIYHAFRKKSDGNVKSIYYDVLKLPAFSKSFEKKLTEFILKNDIDVVVNMSRFFRHKSIAKAAKNSGEKVKVIFMQHFAPGSEMKKPTFKAGFHLLKLNPYNPVYWIRSTIYPLIKLPRQLRYKNVYRDTYQSSDRIILLSEGYVSQFCKIAKISDTSKFIGIPNIFEPEKKDDSFHNKEKRVLILSRMDEIQKRLSVALLIWAQIEKDVALNDWHLDIVGSGHNKDIVKRMIRRLKLSNVTYHGWQNRVPYLEKSSILLSTSEYEGLPLSILEAQAYGVVPIAFNSYESLKDVIIPYENGVLVENFGDIDDFTNKLKDLMYSMDYREEISKNALSLANRFSSEKIISKWIEMLDSL